MGVHTKMLLGRGPDESATFSVEVLNEGWGASTPDLAQAMARARRESAWSLSPVAVRDWAGNLVAVFAGGEAL